MAEFLDLGTLRQINITPRELAQARQRVVLEEGYIPVRIFGRKFENRVVPTFVPLGETAIIMSLANNEPFGFMESKNDQLVKSSQVSAIAMDIHPDEPNAWELAVELPESHDQPAALEVADVDLLMNGVGFYANYVYTKMQE